MGTNKNLKKYVLISGFNTHDNNRGTAALGYGAISFCAQKGYLTDGQEILSLRPTKKIWKHYEDIIEEYKIGDKVWCHRIKYVSAYAHKILKSIGIYIPFSSYGKIIREVQLVAAINGGDGFSDIYGKQTFYNRLPDIKFAMKIGIPIVFLPQTLGPFENESNYKLAEKILKYATKIFIRDNKFVEQLNRMGVDYTETKDLSAYMQPEFWDIDIKQNSVGINVSGLCYSNTFRSLSGQFSLYPELIERLIVYFRNEGKTVYLIPHSYHYDDPEPSNDDIEACRMAYDRLEDKTNIILLDDNLTSPQVKYVISKMSFFIGTRMHSNFAAIYTHVPVFGLAYSYKFAGAFDSNGLSGEKQTAMINNITAEDVKKIITKIVEFYKSI